METSPKKQDCGSPRLYWRFQTSSWRTQELMSVKLRIQEEELLSKDICRSTVSLSMLSFFVDFFYFCTAIIHHPRAQVFNVFHSKNNSPNSTINLFLSYFDHSALLPMIFLDIIFASNNILKLKPGYCY